MNPIVLSDQVYELRMPKTRQGTISGYFDSVAGLYKSVAGWDGKVPGIYVTLNPVKSALLARAKNRLQTHAKTTTADADVLRREWLLIDCDAVRPADISSTDAEHQAALERSNTIISWLLGQGWPAPLIADSGNGGHLLYRIDLANDSASRDLVKAVLEVLALRFNNDVITIDTSVYNAARITKLYGTMCCKGDSTDDRPHRRSKILAVPNDLITVPHDVLLSLAKLRPADPRPAYQGMNGGTRFDLHDFMQRHSLVVAREKSWNGATVFELAECPFNADHIRDSSIIQFSSGALAFQCFHNSCQAHHWQDVRNLFEPYRVPRTSPATSSSDPGRAEFTLITADKVTMKPVKWIIQGRVPLGMVTVLAGRSGIAKSTIAIEWGAQVTTGKAAGALAGSPGHVIISSTEDTEAETLTPRLTAAKADMGKVHFIHLHRGGVDGSLTIPDDLDVLERAIQQTGAKFVIIDPLMAHLSARLNSWSDHEIRQALTPLSRLAETLSVTILIIAHLNKDATKEVLDRIGGSIGTGNTARSVLFAGRDPNDPDGQSRMLAHPKCNVGAEQPTLRYHTEIVFLDHDPDPIETTKIVWDGEAPGVTAEDLVAKSDPISREDKAQAVDWLEKALPAGKKRKQIDLEAEAKQAGISTWPLRKAKAILQVKSKKEGFNPAVWFWWRLTTAYQTTPLTPSGQNDAKYLKNAKAYEGETAHIFDASSTPEGASKSSSLLFDASSNISTTYIPSSLEGESQGSYIEEEVDLRVD